MKLAIVLLAILALAVGSPRKLVRDQITDQTHFFLFTSSNPSRADEIIPGRPTTLGNFDPDNDVKIIIHGYTESGDSNWMADMKDAFLAREPDLNVINVDWGRLANGLYGTAVDNTKPVGLYVGELVSFLLDEGSDYDRIHLIGFSLGGEIVGFAGASHNGQIARITGLDPAYPYYQNTDESGHLDPSDGVFVDVIHTDSGELFNGTIGAGFSFSEPLGHIDFYPNGGHRQPGCHDAGAALPDISTVCSHLRCYNLYIESIKDVNAFDSYLCKDYDEYGTGSCIDNCPAGGCPKLGYNVRTSDAGIFYLSTRDKEPFDGKQVYVTIAFANNQDKQEGHILLTLDGDSVSDTAEVLNEDSPLNSNVVYKKAVAYLNDLEDYTSGKVAFEKDGLIDSSAAHIASIEVYDPEAGTRVCTGEVRVPAGSSERIGFENC